jgi:sulfate transporter 3
VDGNKEMIAIGLMNMIGSSTSCYVTTGTGAQLITRLNQGRNHDIYIDLA